MCACRDKVLAQERMHVCMQASSNILTPRCFGTWKEMDDKHSEPHGVHMHA